MSEKGRQLASTHNGKLRFEQQNNRIIFDGDDGLAQLLIGIRNDGQLAVDAAPPGTDVLTAADIDLSFSSRFRSFKIVDSDTISFASPNSAGTSSFHNVSHVLGYNPIVLAFVSFSPTGTGFPLPYNDIALSGADTGKVRFQVGFETVGGDTITFYYRDITAATSNTAYIRYYILQETAATT